MSEIPDLQSPPRPAPSPDVSIIIVSWNTRDLLDACLASIYRHTEGVRFEIWVVDNGSTDGTPAMIRERYPAVKLLEPGENLGFARANNLALKQAAGRHVLFLNPDTELRSNVVADFCRRLDEDPSIGILGCRLVGSEGETQLTCAATYPTPWNTLCAGLFLHHLASRFPRLSILASRSLEHWDHLSARDVDCLSGAFLFGRGRVVRAMGGFDEGYYMYGEDLDLCLRVRSAGYRVCYDPSHTVLHVGGTAARQRPNTFARRQQFHANCRLLRKHFGGFRVVAYRLSVVGTVLFRIVALAVAFPFARRARGLLRHHLRANLQVLAEALRRPVLGPRSTLSNAHRAVATSDGKAG